MDRRSYRNKRAGSLNMTTTDVSKNWADAKMVMAQRKVVDEQLHAMYADQPPKHFRVFGVFLQCLHAFMDVPSCSLLDVGCASAYYCEIAEYYVPNWIRYSGFDYSPSMLALARKQYPDITTIHGDVYDLDILSHHYDIVLSGALLPHIREWKVIVEKLITVTGQFLILHRTWVFVDDTPTSGEVKPTYGGVPVWFGVINEQELLNCIAEFGLSLFMEVSGVEPARGGEYKVKSYVFQRGTNG